MKKTSLRIQLLIRIAVQGFLELKGSVLSEDVEKCLRLYVGSYLLPKFRLQRELAERRSSKKPDAQKAENIAVVDEVQPRVLRTRRIATPSVHLEVSWRSHNFYRKTPLPPLL